MKQPYSKALSVQIYSEASWVGLDIRELEAEKAHLADCKPPRADMVHEEIEADRRAIARLQQVIDALR